jgi:hypothetical protein
MMMMTICPTKMIMRDKKWSNHLRMIFQSQSSTCSSDQFEYKQIFVTESTVIVISIKQLSDFSQLSAYSCFITADS